MQTRAPIKKPFAHIRQNGDNAKGFIKEKSKDSGIIPDFPVLSNIEELAGMVAGASVTHAAALYFPLDRGAGCRYLAHANKKPVDSRHLKTCFFHFLHPIKSFSVKNRVAARPLTLVLAFAILGGFLFLGGHTMQDKFEAPSYPPPHTVPNPPPPIITERQETKQPGPYQEHSRAFCTWYEHPVDILNNAENIIQFLEDVCPAMIDDCGNLGLSKKGMNGLAIIYQTLGETIRAAVEAIAAENQAPIAQGVKS